MRSQVKEPARRDGLGPSTVEGLEAALAQCGYLADRDLATAIYLALRLGRPLLLEGEAGVGKTEVAKVLAQLLDTELIRLQCHEGLDLHQAAYEWDYARQMLEIRLLEASGNVDRGQARQDLFATDFLLERPLLAALRHSGNDGQPPVLLIDELDRADEEFEAFLLELLSDFQITVPELGTLRAQQVPVVVLTSNRTREVHDALRRRCLYQWLNYPSFAKELAIVESKVPAASSSLSQRVVAVVQELRASDLSKQPGIAETLDWARALVALDAALLSPELLAQSLGVLLKYQDDIQQVRENGLDNLLARAEASLDR